MNTYLDVAVVRIQSWLTRVHHLRGRRGASAMIRRATDPEAIDSLLAEHRHLVRRCTEAGHVDGVVPLLLHSDDAETVAWAEQHVIRHLRGLLPGVSLHSSLRRGESWLDAHHSGDIRSEREWPPAVAEWPPGKQCEWCHVWPACEQRKTGSGESREWEALCLDCVGRDDNAGRSSSSKENLVPGTERELLERWEERDFGAAAGVPNKFPELVELGPREDNTHLATVYADGNAVGLFGERLHRARPRNSGFDMPAAIDEATWSGLLEAVRSVTAEGSGPLPISAHLVGGDDVLVSLPAHRAWRFVRTLQERFGASLRESLNEEGMETLEAPTLSAAAVFHHHSSPLATAVDLAGQLLARTKKHHRGRTAALVWQDITHDGPYDVGRAGIPLDTLRSSWDDLRALAELGGSARANLAALARADDPGRLHEHARRLGIDGTVERFTPNSMNLLDALGMVRWWKEDA